MIIRRALAISALLSLTAGPLSAADDAPQPTTSPTNSRDGTLIQTDVFPDDEAASKLKVSQKNLDRFVKARAAIGNDVASFQKMAAAASKNLTPAEQQQLKGLLADIRKQAGAVSTYAKASGNPAAEKIASQLIINDDILGEQAMIVATAKLLADLDAQLGLLEPVVHR